MPLPQTAVESFEIQESIFFLGLQSDRRKLLQGHQKKRLLIENLQRMAGIGTLFHLLLKKVLNK